ncbi:hypothetical protein M422DRAFT_248749 [Sphaerobolus stellatus SS14]|nr:hypothetical protein M422DRAFT_248749 [Sphaerobolus stellatus SS14]
MPSLPSDVDALIVGAGPAGLAAAISLKQLGVNLAIVDGSTINRNGSRASIVHTRTLEVLDTLGLANQIIQAGTPSEGEIFLGSQDHLITVELPLIESMTKFPLSVLIGQDEVEKILKSKLNSLNGQIRVDKKTEALSVLGIS